MKYVVVISLALLGCSREPPPTVSLSANPASVDAGQCTTLTWSSTNAAAVEIDQRVGKVDPSGSKQVCPGGSMQYTITATGGSGTVTETVSVTALAARVMTFPEAALFEFGKAELKPEGKEQISAYREQAREALGRADQVMITGYTDNVGEDADNFALSLQRAEAVRDQLVSLGADANKFHVAGAGEANPIADNNTDEGRAKNRRVEVAVAGVEKSPL
jgi:outer membrane protein OmpA-like peptidoglycan-associated protein